MKTYTTPDYTFTFYYGIGTQRRMGHEIRREVARIYALATERAHSIMNSDKNAVAVKLSTAQSTGVSGVTDRKKKVTAPPVPYKRIAPMDKEQIWQAVQVGSGFGLLCGCLIYAPIEYITGSVGFSLWVGAVAGVGVAGVGILVMLDVIDATLIEPIIGLDLNNDGVIGDPQEPILEMVWFKGDNQQKKPWGLTKRQTRALLEKMEEVDGKFTREHYMKARCTQSRFPHIKRDLVEFGAVEVNDKGKYYLNQLGFDILHDIATGNSL